MYGMPDVLVMGQALHLSLARSLSHTFNLVADFLFVCIQVCAFCVYIFSLWANSCLSERKKKGAESVLHRVYGSKEKKIIDKAQKIKAQSKGSNSKVSRMNERNERTNERTRRGQATACAQFFFIFSNSAQTQTKIRE
jgi:hypothetical protein